MSEKNTYGPEDIEELLREKAFNELYPEEKEYVLKHVSGEEEYSQLQATLGSVMDSSRDNEFAPPDPKVKEALMNEFRLQHQQQTGRPTWSLNSLFNWIGSPVLRYAVPSLALILLVLGLWWIFPSDSLNEKAIAVVQEEESEPITKELDSAADVLTPKESEEELFAPSDFDQSEYSESESPSNEESISAYSDEGDDISLRGESAESMHDEMELDDEPYYDQDVEFLSDESIVVESVEEMEELIEEDMAAAPEAIAAERAITTVSRAGSISKMSAESEIEDQSLKLSILSIGLLYTAK